MKLTFFNITNEISFKKIQKKSKNQILLVCLLLDLGLDIKFEASGFFKKGSWKNKKFYQNKWKKKFQRLAPKFILYKILHGFHEKIEDTAKICQNKSRIFVENVTRLICIFNYFFPVSNIYDIQMNCIMY